MTDLFRKIAFRGTFRSYQQGVLDRSGQYLEDGRIHIVAAPGSGKTILGLELIRRLNERALILSPSVTIRQQWGERFEQFLPESPSGEDGGREDCAPNADDFVSYDLKAPKLITSATYQALHAAVNRLAAGEKQTVSEDDSEWDAAPQDEDFSEFNLFSELRSARIRTICLDEAHHLRSEWQKALELFVQKLDPSVKIISLTATPPYDSSPAEWKKYISLCGEIDDEIFVPQLVAQKSLCPHQDYVWLNEPTEEEKSVIRAYRSKARDAEDEAFSSGLVRDAVERSCVLSDFEGLSDVVFEFAEDFAGLLSAACVCGFDVPKRMIKALSPGGLPKFSAAVAERLFQFILDHPEIFGEELSESLRKLLSGYGVIERRKVCLTANQKLDRLLVSSLGKLRSITEIVRIEKGSLGESLRMLVLTDFIKKDFLKDVGTDAEIPVMGTVPIFEAIRRSCGKMRLGILSGTLILLPESARAEAERLAAENGIVLRARPIPNGVGYFEAEFGGAGKQKVAIVTELFRSGLIQVLVGTKSLLGEGWDSPCINSLILASFVGSFMLSNQMRGRAIRVDREHPEKTADIWHLVTIRKEAEGFGADFDMLERRFECFLAPAYDRSSIESGLDRINILSPAFERAELDVNAVNSQMELRAGDREAMRESWENPIREADGELDVCEACLVPPTVCPKSLLFFNLSISASFCLLSLAYLLLFLYSGVENRFFTIGSMAAICVLAALAVFFGIRAYRFMSPARTARTMANCLLHALRETGEVKSHGAEIIIELCRTSETSYQECLLSGATTHEKKVFFTALGEMLSCFENPRYLLVKRRAGKRNRRVSYAVPTVLGVKRETAETLCRQLSAKAGSFELVYTRDETGRQEFLKCRRKSYVNAYEILATGRQIAGNWSDDV